MEEEKKVFETSPACTRVLIIGNSKYNSKSEQTSMIQPKNDAE